MAKRLAVLAGPDEGRVFPLTGDTLLLGRSRATEGHLIDPHLSRVHCQVQPETDGTVVTDFDSAGGTFVNGAKISRHVLQTGDIIRIGGTRLQYVEDGEAAAASSPSAAPMAAAVSSNWAKQLEGQLLSHYKVGPTLARSKTGYIFHARDTRRNQALVLKVLNPEYALNEEKVHRFVEAMKAVLPLRHPNLVRLFGAGKTGTHIWVAGEYVRCESLAAVIGRVESTGLPDWRQVLKVGILLARALDYAHQKKMVHQNVTPHNILIASNIPHSKLADLGLASALDGDPTTPISAAGVPSEELSYMPPERTDGPTKPIDGRADIYSLGASLYAMLTGKAPLQANTVTELVNKIRLVTPVRLHTLQLGIPEGLELIIQKMLAKRPEDRYQSAKDMLKDMERFAQSYNVTV